MVVILCSSIRFRKPYGKWKMKPPRNVGLSYQINAALPANYINVPDKERGVETP